MSAITAPTSVLPFPEARLLVEREAARLRPGEPESVPLLEAAGRVLAQALYADRDLPPFPRSARDGFAIHADDLPHLPCSLRIVGEVRAGSASDIRLSAGETAEVMTGAAVPPGSAAVVMVEHTRRESGSISVEIKRRVSFGENIVPRGSEARLGELLIEAGTRVAPSVMAVAATVGQAVVKVFRRPRVAILATGDELVDVGAQPGAAQIRNCNSYSLAAQVLKAGAVPVLLPLARDEVQALRSLILEGIKSDLLLLSGGVSAGKYDLVETVLGELGAELLFTGVLIQPGKPLVFGRFPRPPAKFFFGLPGNPVSTMVTFTLFVRPVIEALSGARIPPLIFPQAKLRAEIRTKTGLTRFLPALLRGSFGQPEVELAAWQGSGDVAGTARANCFVVVPPDRDVIPAGEMVSLLLD